MPDSQTSPKNFPALDGLRGFSILLVVLSHANLQHVVPGGLGVVIFFVISGFLITRLMLEEITKTGGLNIRLFYLRRLLRLMPTLLLFLILFVPIVLFLGAAVTPVQIASVVFYFSNYYHIFVEYPPASLFPIFWSLAVEEHFYIVFPFLIWALRRHVRALTFFLGLLAVCMLGWRFYLHDLCIDGAAPYDVCGVSSQIDDRIFHGTDSIADCILYGALTSLLLFIDAARMKRVFINNAAFLGALGVMLFTLLCRNAEFRDTLRYTLQAAGAAIIILNISYGAESLPQKARMILASKIPVTVGHWSYALYLFHYAMLIMIKYARHGEDRLSGPVDMLAYFTGTFLLSWLTYRGVEKPLQKWRKKFHPHIKVG